ncbi:hypothetical protein EJD97_013153 [Solanum chilense]|uniref:Secreted protein n=1 Tax=Solanum chilense TaxID=4083 RepID=A0A6N2AIN4_SOLCI|nr:hypothetical protein EJD97_013153 [Solanum chilense]
MPCPTSSVCVCNLNLMMACHLDVIRTCVLDKGYNVIPRLIYFHRVCYPRAKMACHTRRHPTVCAAQWPCGYATPDVNRLFVLSKGDGNMQCTISSDHVCFPREMIICHTQRRPTV